MQENSRVNHEKFITATPKHVLIQTRLRSTIIQTRWKSVLSYIGTTHNCSKYIHRSKNVLVPKWAKKSSGWDIKVQASVIETHPDRELSSCNRTGVMTSHSPHPQAQEKRDNKPLCTGIIKWFFLCSVYGPMVIH